MRRPGTDRGISEFRIAALVLFPGFAILILTALCD